MPPRPSRSLLAAGVLALIALAGSTVGSAGLAAGAQPGADEAERIYPEFIARFGPALVTVKMVLKVQFQGEEHDEEMELTGVMIEPTGLVLASNMEMGGYYTMMGRLGGEVSATPTDVKVLVGDDEEGAKARVLARDSDLDLAWIQIETPPEKPYAFVDMADSVEPVIGQRLYEVNRMGKFYDRALLVAEGRLGGTTTRPRRLYMPTGLYGGLGLPIFTASGKVVGVSINQSPEPEDQEADSTGMFADFGIASGPVLPAAEVIKATQRSKEHAPQNPAGEAPPPPPADKP